MVGEPSCLHTWLTFEGTFPQGFLVLLCLRLVPLITGHHLPTPHCLASHFLPGVSLFAQAFLPHLEIPLALKEMENKTLLCPREFDFAFNLPGLY